MNILRKWWFWLIIVLIVLAISVIPLFPCGVLSYEGSTNEAPTGTTTIYITVFDFLTKGCVY